MLPGASFWRMNPNGRLFVLDRQDFVFRRNWKTQRNQFTKWTGLSKALGMKVATITWEGTSIISPLDKPLGVALTETWLGTVFVEKHTRFSVRYPLINHDCILVSISALCITSPLKLIFAYLVRGGDDFRCIVSICPIIFTPWCTDVSISDSRQGYTDWTILSLDFKPRSKSVPVSWIVCQDTSRATAEPALSLALCQSLRIWRQRLVKKTIINGFLGHFASDRI